MKVFAKISVVVLCAMLVAVLAGATVGVVAMCQNCFATEPVTVVVGSILLAVVALPPVVCACVFVPKVFQN